MRSRPPAAIWMGSALCAAVCLVAAIFIVCGAGEKGTITALLATARVAFLLFWPAYAGGALVSLFGARFQPLKRRAREFGLAFAAALLVHLGMVAWLCRIGHAPSVQTFVVFGVAAVCVLLLTLFSMPRLHSMLHPKGWWFLRIAGMNYVALAFALDFLKDPLHGGLRHVVLYLPFAVLAVAGPGARLAVLVQRAGRSLTGSTYRTG